MGNLHKVRTDRHCSCFFKYFITSILTNNKQPTNFSRNQQQPLETRGIPYDGMQPVQAAMHVIKGNRLDLPSGCPSWYKSLVDACWHGEPEKRPTMIEVKNLLSKAIVAVAAEQKKLDEKKKNEARINANKM